MFKYASGQNKKCICNWLRNLNDIFFDQFTHWLSLGWWQICNIILKLLTFNIKVMSQFVSICEKRQLHQQRATLTCFKMFEFQEQQEIIFPSCCLFTGRYFIPMLTFNLSQSIIGCHCWWWKHSLCTDILILGACWERKWSFLAFHRYWCFSGLSARLGMWQMKQKCNVELHDVENLIR